MHVDHEQMSAWILFIKHYPPRLNNCLHNTSFRLRQDFLKIMKQKLQNFKKLLKKYLLTTDYSWSIAIIVTTSCIKKLNILSRVRYNLQEWSIQYMYIIINLTVFKWTPDVCNCPSIYALTTAVYCVTAMERFVIDLAQTCTGW